MSEPDLIGYVLDLLEDAERAAVESWLAQSAAARDQLSRLRAWLQALALNENDPPGELSYRTLRRIVALEISRRQQSMVGAEEGIAARAGVTVPVGSREGALLSSRGRWVDMLVVVGVLAFLAALVPPAVLQARYRQEIVACQDNLRLLHTALKCYADNHGGCLPTIPERGPLAFAGMFVVMLREEQTWDERISMVCPANRRKLAGASAASRLSPPLMDKTELTKSITADVLRRWAESDDDARQLYREACRQLGGCYAYHLGYRDDHGRLHGLRLEDEGGLPVLGDRPPRCEEEPIHWRSKNSPNHGGFGQNVLFLSGHVRFQRCRHCSGLDEDIYLNRQQQLAAGCDRCDAVLGPSEASPGGVLLADNR